MKKFSNTLNNPGLNFALIGDLGLSGLISSKPELNEVRFSKISEFLSKSDFCIANLESPVEGNGEINQNKKIISFASPDVTKTILKLLNVQLVSLANNHIYDCRLSGLKNTIQALEDIGVRYTGAGFKKEHVEPVIFNKNGSQIGFIAYVDRSTNPGIVKENKIFINFINEEKIIKQIQKLRNETDLVIVSLHWGVDYSNFFTSQQQTLARNLIIAGADVIMGHHSHTIQPIEIYNKKLIFYGLGGLVYGDYQWEGQTRSLMKKTKKGLIALINENLAITTIKTKELKGNFIEYSKRNRIRSVERLYRINTLKNRCLIVSFLVNIKEGVLDLVADYFFGYYRSPIKNLFQKENFRKLRKHLNKPI